jgi:hypothetical protein
MGGARRGVGEDDHPLVFAMDKWFTAPILGERSNPIGLPNTGSADFRGPASITA